MSTVGNAIQKQSYEFIALRLRASQGCVYSSLKLAEYVSDDGFNIAMAKQARAQATESEREFVEAELGKIFKKDKLPSTSKSHYGYLIGLFSGLFVVAATYFCCGPSRKPAKDPSGLRP